jgi:hypothetical protein
VMRVLQEGINSAEHGEFVKFLGGWNGVYTNKTRLNQRNGVFGCFCAVTGLLGKKPGFWLPLRPGL